jgi:glutamate/tyrosine decarboxylase-like PLP-dependent enzyme
LECDWLTTLAFGLLARLLDPKRFPVIAQGVNGLEFADSITGDAHKLFNVPYDCGLFFSAHPDISLEVFENPGAPYMASGDNGADSILSPLNVGIENSRRFRALPLYASLRRYGTKWYTDMLERQIETARLIAKWIRDSPYYVLLPDTSLLEGYDQDEDYRHEVINNIFIIVLFKAKDDRVNENLVSLVNAAGQIYVSGTVWQGSKAARIAVANWKVDPERESSTVVSVLSAIAQKHSKFFD